MLVPFFDTNIFSILQHSY